VVVVVVVVVAAAFLASVFVVLVAVAAPLTFMAAPVTSSTLLALALADWTRWSEFSDARLLLEFSALMFSPLTRGTSRNRDRQHVLHAQCWWLDALRWQRKQRCQCTPLYRDETCSSHEQVRDQTRLQVAQPGQAAELRPRLFTYR
jgi:hypothetical protein